MRLNYIISIQVPFIRSISPSLSGFRKDDASNLICRECQLLPYLKTYLKTSNYMCLSTVCFSHRRQYDDGYYVLVPSKRQRDALLNHEHIDFSHRESQIASSQPDPGRTFPHVSTRGNALNFNLLTLI